MPKNKASALRTVQQNYLQRKSATQRKRHHYCPVNLKQVMLKGNCSKTFGDFKNFSIPAKMWFFAT